MGRREVVAVQEDSDVLLQLWGKDRLSSTAAAEAQQLQRLQHVNGVNSIT